MDQEKLQEEMSSQMQNAQKRTDEDSKKIKEMKTQMKAKNKKNQKLQDELSRTKKNLEAIKMCPITQQVMVDPVMVAQTGNTYDRPAIEQWWESNKTDPLTNTEVENPILIQNNVLR